MLTVAAGCSLPRLLPLRAVAQAADPIQWSQEGQGREGAGQKLPLKTRSLPGRCLRRLAQG